MAQRTRAISASLILLFLGLTIAPMVHATDASAEVTNAAPSVVATYFYATDPASGAASTCPVAGRATTFAPAPGTTRTIFVCVEVTDANGFNDVCAAGSTRTYDVTNSADVVLRNDFTLSCDDGSGTAVAVLGSFTLEYWRPVGVATSSTAYKVVVSIADVEASGATHNSAFDYSGIKAINAPASINLGGSLAPGATADEVAANVNNYGNQAFNVMVSGTALTGGEHAVAIAAASLKWGATASVAYGTKTAVTGSAVDTTVAAPIETSAVVTNRPVYLQLAIPAVTGAVWVPADTYTGTVTFTASS